MGIRISNPNRIQYKDGSEAEHQKMLDHFRTKISHEIFAKTNKEKDDLIREQRRHPSKRHAPDNRQFNEISNRG